jgi:hypothetical protein
MLDFDPAPQMSQDQQANGYVVGHLDESDIHILDKL